MFRRKLLFLIIFGIILISFFSVVFAEDLVVGIANHAAGNEFVNYMVTEMQARLTELGVKYDYAVADGTLEAHTNNIETLISKGLKVVIIIGGDADGLKPMEKLAVEKGVKLISADTGLSGQGVLTDVTSDNKLIGKLMAYFLIAKLDGEGEIVIFREPYYTPCRIRWMEGAKPIFDQYPGIKIVGDTAIQFPQGTPQAMAAMENHLVAHPEIKGVWAVYDQPALGAIQALLAAGRKDVTVVGADGDKLNILDYISKGLLEKGTVAQNSGAMGRICADVAVQYLKGEKVEFSEHIYAPVTLVVKGNALSFAKKLNWIK